MLLKFYYYNSNKPQFITEFNSDIVPRIDERIKLGKKRYKIVNVVYRMKGDGSKLLHARINLN